MPDNLNHLQQLEAMVVVSVASSAISFLQYFFSDDAVKELEEAGLPWIGDSFICGYWVFK